MMGIEDNTTCTRTKVGNLASWSWERERESWSAQIYHKTNPVLFEKHKSQGPQTPTSSLIKKNGWCNLTSGFTSWFLFIQGLRSDNPENEETS